MKSTNFAIWIIISLCSLGCVWSNFLMTTTLSATTASVHKRNYIIAVHALECLHYICVSETTSLFEQMGRHKDHHTLHSRHTILDTLNMSMQTFSHQTYFHIRMNSVSMNNSITFVLLKNHHYDCETHPALLFEPIRKWNVVNGPSFSFSLFLVLTVVTYTGKVWWSFGKLGNITSQ